MHWIFFVHLLLLRSCISLVPLTSGKAQTVSLNQTANFWVASATGAKFHPQEQDKQHHGLGDVVLIAMPEYLKKPRSLKLISLTGTATKILCKYLQDEATFSVLIP